ncbi:MAG: hypothetical protein ACQCN4_00200 [Candidatus Bathyarchaeia archaeon]|jgi:phosphoribosylanthranilate isomerase
MESDYKLDSEDFQREVRKLEIRLNDYLEEEEIFVKNLRCCISQLNALHAFIVQLHAPLSAENIKEISNRKAEAVHSLSEALKIEGKAEHEKSHLLESYGALIVLLQAIEVT